MAERMPHQLRGLALTAVTALVSAVLAGSAVVDNSSALSEGTRLVHGPLVFRLTGQELANKKDPTVDYDSLYAVVFKLNRDPLARYRPVPNAGPINSRGRYQIANVDFDELVSPLYDRPRPPGTAYCFAAFIDGPSTGLPRLDRVAAGRSVKVRLRPLTTGEDGNPKLGKTYTSRSRMRTADVRFNDRSVRRQLRAIRC